MALETEGKGYLPWSVLAGAWLDAEVRGCLLTGIRSAEIGQDLET